MEDVTYHKWCLLLPGSYRFGAKGLSFPRYRSFAYTVILQLRFPTCVTFRECTSLFFMTCGCCFRRVVSQTRGHTVEDSYSTHVSNKIKRENMYYQQNSTSDPRGIAS